MDLMSTMGIGMLIMVCGGWLMARRVFGPDFPLRRVKKVGQTAPFRAGTLRVGVRRQVVMGPGLFEEDDNLPIPLPCME